MLETRPRKTRAEVRAQLVAFYEVANPSKVALVDEYLDRAGTGNEELLLATVRRKCRSRVENHAPTSVERNPSKVGRESTLPSLGTRRS